ncbi:redoxin domain-containing protein [Pedobacter jamesrossensis]|uniref:Redoxin domain-containing protein n=1 Tax=Pedobacter jamesrossensis TaxID=1908238 RepID=A0ABV8NJW3_9SPHI
MKRFLFLTICLLPLSLFAQSSFTICGFGKGFKDGDKIFLSYRQSGQIVDDSTIVNRATFKFKGSINTKVRGYLSRNNNPRYAEDLFDSFSIYIEAGQITLNSADTLSNSTISGTPSNNDYAELLAALDPLNKQIKKLKDSNKELKDTALLKLNKTKLETAYYDTFPVQFNFIANHPDSYVSLLTLGNMARNSKFLPQVEQSFTNLNPDLKAMPEGKEIARRIIEDKKISVGMLAKDFTQNDIIGNPIKLSSYRGKYVLVDFWASWCLPCREENPNLLSAYQQYKSKKFAVLSVSIDTDKMNWLNAIKEDKLPWMQVSDLKKENEVAKLYGVTTIPSNVLIDPDGKIIAKDIKGKDLRDTLLLLLGSK